MLEYLHKRRFINRRNLASYMVAVARQAYSQDCLVARFDNGDLEYQQTGETPAEFHERIRRDPRTLE